VAALCRPKQDLNQPNALWANGSKKINQRKTMFIKLTNSSPMHKDQPIAIRRDLIVTVHMNTIVRDDGTIDTVTFLFVPPHGTWEVKEDYDTVIKLLNGEQVDEPKSKSRRSLKSA